VPNSLDRCHYTLDSTPLVVNLAAGGDSVQVIVMHTKSNFVNNGQGMWNDPAQRPDFVAMVLKARRRNATEGMRVRQYLDARLQADPGARLIVLGDLNDGPGLDYFERNHLAHNVTDVVVGSAEPEWTSPGLSAGTGLRRVPGSGTVHHAEYDAQLAHGGAKREDRPSNHRPVSVQLTY
jgi:hypothetical protein